MSEIMTIMGELEAAIQTVGGLDHEAAEHYKQRVLQEIDDLKQTLSKRDMQRTSMWFRPQDLELLRSYLSRAFYARCTAFRPVYNHLVIAAADENLSDARRFAARLGNAAAEFFNEDEKNYARIVQEEQFLSCSDQNNRAALLRELGECRMILIPTFQADDLERFEKVLESLGIGRYSVVLCVSKEAAIKIRNYSHNDYRLSRYLLRQTYFYEENTYKDVYEYACRQLENGDLTLTDEFREKLDIYVQAVYPEAVLRGADFVLDLLIRIEDSRADRLCFDSILTAEDVPYSEKAERLLEEQSVTDEASEDPAYSEDSVTIDLPPDDELAITDIPDLPIKQREETPDIQDITNEEFAELSYKWDTENDSQIPVPEQAKKLDGRPVNVLLLAMSTFPSGNILRKAEFVDKDDPDGGRVYIGRGQLDPVPKKIAHDLKTMESPQVLDYVVILCTDKAETDVEKLTIIEDAKRQYQIAKVSPIDFFEAQIKPYLNPDIQSTFIKVQVQDNLADAVGNAVGQIRELAAKSTAAEDKKLHLYIDIHGGPRDTQMITQSVMSLLETDTNRIDTKMYTVVNDPSQGGYIAQSDETIRIQRFVAGITEVMTYGRTASLHQYFDQNASDSIQSIMGTLDKIADGISWCDVDIFEKGLRELINYSWRKLQQEDQSAYLRLFRENIQNGFGGLLNRKSTVIDEIRWCVDKGFYQQALALIESRIPDYLHEHGIFTPQADVIYEDGERPVRAKEQYEAFLYQLKDDYIDAWEKADTVFSAKNSSIDWKAPDCLNKALLINTADIAYIRKASKLSLKAKDKTIPRSFSICFNTANKDDDAKKTLQVAVFQKLIKEHRNRAMHVDRFFYKSDRIKAAIPAYLRLLEDLVKIADPTTDN